MNCKKCGNPITENDKFCPACGEAVVIETPVAPVMPEAPVAPAEPVVPETPVQAEPAPAANPTPIITEPIANNTALPTEPKKKSGGFIVIVIILGLIIIGLGVFIAIKMLGDKSDNGTTNNANTNTNNSQTVNNNTNTNSNTNNNSNTVTPTTSSTTTTIGSYTFTVPSDLKVVEKNGEKYYGNENVVLFLDSMYYGYNTIIANIDSVKQEIANYGTILDSKEVVIENNKYYIFKLIVDGVEMEYFYTSLDEYETLNGAIKYQTISREKAYGYVNQMLKTKKSGASSFAGNEEKFELLKPDVIKDVKVK